MDFKYTWYTASDNITINVLGSGGDVSSDNHTDNVWRLRRVYGNGNIEAHAFFWSSCNRGGGGGVRRLRHCEYASKYESLKFALNSSKICE